MDFVKKYRTSILFLLLGAVQVLAGGIDWIAQFLLRIVMPRSFSSGFESIIKLCWPPANLSSSSVLNMPDW